MIGRYLRVVLRKFGRHIIEPAGAIEQFYATADPWDYEKTPDDQTRKAKLLQVIGQYVPTVASARVLDVGCGEGWITQDLPGGEIVGIDVSAIAIERARRANRRGYYRRFDLNLDDPKTLGGFDVVIITGVLYKNYLTQPAAMKLLTLLKPGGYLVMSHISEWDRWHFDLPIIYETRFSYRKYTQHLQIMHKPAPQVTIGMPVRGDAPIIESAIASVGRQTYPNLEFILVDDGMTDSTKQMALTALNQLPAHIQRQVARHPEPRGVAAARNTVVQRAMGEFVTFLSADDVLYDDKIERQVEPFAADIANLTGAVSVRSVLVTPDGHRSIQPAHIAQGNIYPQILSRNLLTSPMIRKICYRQVGEYDTGLQFGEDWELHIRLARLFQTKYIDTQLIRINTHRDQISSRASQRANDCIKIWRKHQSEYSDYPRAASDLWRFIGVSQITAGEPDLGRRTLARAIWAYPFNSRVIGQWILSLLPIAWFTKIRTGYHQYFKGVNQHLSLKPKTDRPTVLFVISSAHLGGAPMQAYRLISRLLDRINPIVALPDDGPFVNRFRQLGVTVITVSIRRISPVALWQIVKLIHKYKVDLVHSHGKAAGLYGRMTGWITRTPIIHTFHGIHFKKYGLFSPVYLGVEKILGRMTNKFIAVARHEKETATKYGFATDNQVKVIYNGAPTATGLEHIPHADHFTILSIGRFFSGKGQEFLISAMPIIIATIPTVRLTLVGDGPQLNQAKNQTNRLGIEKYINFTGSRTNINDYLYSSDIYVSPSLGEGLPLTLLEAGQAGLPVVATDVTGNNEVIRDGQSGLLVPPNNPEKLAQAIVNLYQQPLIAKRYASALQKEIQEEFGLQRMLDQTLELYHEVLTKNDWVV
ncbi:hypothetical protein A3K24_01495 [candidate division Kazan bacterium RIFCSPHIGHO2_01_FULL_44_14]|uniref:Glycosyltransferase n=1 Tax=candidate division Kazan bacterium RIFCSPLOWO2_01_FULL_45_19 TaxID=1798538 RepID=A0A1F4NQ33_UNCK3|nr:hypothetical protein [uncultured bacterium]OGB73510.1 MAG: hypothetical protein A3K51_01495 [candidate division Kazan bacterium RIFCSPLOWO2_01_FULL_45_19]OGB77755.1 MAG: hypothetical protein A3K24_01495 [candidate division Kazan bacterium RIFCSPHIGHO2_01_FULL_44_14]